jgi:hypothetical protein
MKLTPSDRNRIRWIVERLHVSASPLTVCRTLWRKGVKGALPGLRKQAYRYAIREHRANRKLFAAVYFGSFK